MLIKQRLLDALSETLEGLAVGAPPSRKKKQEATVLLYAPGEKTARQTPVLEISLFESETGCTLIVNSALGMVELHEVEEVRVSPATREAAFFGRQRAGKMSMVTVSSRGVLQVYSNITRSVSKKELGDIGDEDLRAAVALKVFSDDARVFTNGASTKS